MTRHRAIGQRVRGRKADDEPGDMQAIGLESAGGIEAPARTAPRGGERILVDDALGWRRGGASVGVLGGVVTVAVTVAVARVSGRMDCPRPR